MSDRPTAAPPASPLTPCRVCTLLLLASLVSACGTKTPLALADRPAPPTLLDSLMSTATQRIGTQAQAPVSSAAPQDSPSAAALEIAPSQATPLPQAPSPQPHSQPIRP